MEIDLLFYKYTLTLEASAESFGCANKSQQLILFFSTKLIQTEDKQQR